MADKQNPEKASNGLSLELKLCEGAPWAAKWLELTRMLVPVEFPKFEIPKFDIPPIKLPEIDWEFTFQNLEEHLKQLAMQGWSLPWRLGIPDIRELVTKEPDEIDGFFEAYFEDGGLEKLRQDLLRGNRLDKWRLLLEQCFKNYSSGDFHICIPSLIMVLEGSFNYIAFHNESRRKEFFRKGIKAAAGFKKLTWVSLSCFCDVVFLAVDPRATTDYPNRHKIMHGLDDPSRWRKVDCLRLFQALDSTRRLGESDTE